MLLFFSQVGNDDYHEEYSVLFGFEFARTFQVDRQITVEFETDSYDKRALVEKGL